MEQRAVPLQQGSVKVKLVQLAAAQWRSRPAVALSRRRVFLLQLSTALQMLPLTQLHRPEFQRQKSRSAMVCTGSCRSMQRLRQRRRRA